MRLPQGWRFFAFSQYWPDGYNGIYKDKDLLKKSEEGTK